jgi:transcriptional regulator with XRE-family HTH domain
MNNEKSYSYLSGIYPPGKRDIITKQPETLSVGQRLRRERVLRKLTIEQMATYLDISTAYLGAIERGKRPISSKLMKRIHDRLGLSYDFLLDGMSISGHMISQYVRESTVYTTHHNLNVLLNVCSPEELNSCYNLVHTYLTQNRDPSPEKSH